MMKHSFIPVLKVVSGACAGGGVALLLIFASPLSAQIANVDNILERINALRAEILLLQQELQDLQPAQKKGELFTRNLSIGDSGKDVRALQVLLNEDPETAIAVVGPGSVGNETDFFGARTADAVKRFQEWHIVQILTPLGLKKGTGYVGFSTRMWLNILNKSTRQSRDENTDISPTRTSAEYTQITLPKKPTSPQRQLQSGEVPEGYLHITFPSSYFGPAGTEISLQGYGFIGEDNVVHFGDMYTVTATSVDDFGTLLLLAPDIPIGTYDTWVTNSLGESNKRFFIITAEGAIPPTVVRVSPQLIDVYSRVTIYGSGFAPTGNTIRISYGDIENVSSPDGRVLSFTVEPPFLDGVDLSDPRIKHADFPTWVHVSNDNGMSEGAQFLMNI